jgi:hypothetical protein
MRNVTDSDDGAENVIGRDDAAEGPAGEFGYYRARDGSHGAALEIDLDGPHVMLVVGKRGYGKSYTVGVLAESLARSRGLAPVIVDPMGVFETLTHPSEGDPVPAELVADPAVTPSSIDPRSWCSMLGVAPESGPGSLIWRAAQEVAADGIDAMRDHVNDADAPATEQRAATNFLTLADEWGVFDTDGLTAADLSSPEITVVDVSGMDSAPMNAVARGIAESLYEARVTEAIDRLPWLLFDEAHTFFDGIAEPALRTILTRGRAPGVSLVTATQRPSAIPEVGISQADVIVSHRLTSYKDLEALHEAQPTYMNASFEDEGRMPEAPGEVIVIDDANESVHAANVRTRDTPHGGDSPSVTDLLGDED